LVHDLAAPLKNFFSAGTFYPVQASLFIMAISEDKIKHLLNAWSSGHASTVEEKELFDWIMENDDQAPLREHITSLLQETAGNLPEVDWEHLYQKIRDQSMPVRKPDFNRRWWMAAAAIVIAIAGYLVVNQKSGQPQTPAVVQDVQPGHNGAILTLAGGKKIVLDSLGDGTVITQENSTASIVNGQLVYNSTRPATELRYNTITTPRGRQYTLLLPDGSKVWLNAASQITYPTAFANNERTVTISGEAYFEIAKDKTKTFRVNVDNRSVVKVTGTHFNINSYGDEGTISTTLLEGSVTVSAGTHQLHLQPNQQAIQFSLDSLAVNTDADIAQVTAWKNGLFNFNHAGLHTVMQQLSRWYDIDVKYEGELPDRRFRGKITRDLNLSQVLKLMEDVGIKFRIEGKTLIVTP
jgi:transmembrane sensor